MHHVLFVPLCSTVQRWKLLRKLPAFGVSEEKTFYILRKSDPFKKCIVKFWLIRNWNALFCMAVFFFTFFYSCVKEIKVCDFMHFVQAKWAIAEISPPLWDLGGFVPHCPYFVFSYFPWGSFFCYFIYWLYSSSCCMLISVLACNREGEGLGKETPSFSVSCYEHNFCQLCTWKL